MQSNNRYRSFKQLGQGNFPKSLSGSETDVSTSNENLSNEEKYVIRHTPRQEPQGQENLTDSKRSSLRDSLPSNRSSLDVSSSSYNTLIIHSAGDEPWNGRNSGPREGSNISSNYIIHQSSNLSNDPKLSPLIKRSSTSPSPSISSTGVQEITAIPDDYLNQSSVLKHLAKEVKVPSSPVGTALESNLENLVLFELNALPSPPDYLKWSEKSPLQRKVENRNKINVEKLTLSKSQPDLSTVGVINDDNLFRRGVSAPRPPTKGREENESKGEEIWPSAEMVEILIKENSALKQELENLYQRVERTQRLEHEILKVHKGHEELVQSCERREILERAARARLQSDCVRYQELNKALREQVELLSTQILSRSPVPDYGVPENLRRELAKREGLIKQLISQNKELSAAKERQEIELAAQRATLQEQRTHIDILDTALTNAQGNVVRLEEECRKKQVYVERVFQLQRALSSMQMASERREQTEKKLRLQLERELQRAKSAQGGWDSPNGSGSESASELKRMLREKDERIMTLEGECSRWEQRFLEESTLRQAAIDAASIPKDAKIAALEKTSQETEKIIAEARNEKIRHMDEVHAAQKKVADLESRVKDLESKLAEKDAMIRVLQKHTYEKDMTSMLGRSPLHTPHPSLAGPDIDHVLGTTVSREELVSSVLTNSTAYGSSNSYAGSDSSYHMPSYTKYESSQTYDSTKQKLDNQLKEIDSQLDSQLLSKRALCCFPGFTNPVTAQRKGKIPKPLLAGVTTVSYEQGPFLLPPTRHESGEMLLLEKQGRTSQQQRMPEGVQATSQKPPTPSSLPRPPRSSLRSGLPRRLGEYNRLPDSEKKSDGGDSLSSNSSSRRTSPARSLILPPRKLGEYGRLRSSSAGVERDSVSTVSDNSASSSKVRLYGGGSLRRGSSLGRDSKCSSDCATNKYRIQF
ncbi:227 kDa spindle- and centromere-associated protein-like isoform X2 [Diabrotica virgifera virgifera]|uniref:Angiomotin C-terminal domain-containing protein n=1 Tax=Diabrotica virgifera virgifera TaxID=50390 RepID=A0ABM5JIM1_DIAVI|nr:227 kDa spindle- and centromere-associated protein-like isoform X2 [Diabrotica virgifera virgifera]